MAIFGGYRADRLIAEVRESGDPGSPKAKAALEKLRSMGPNAITPIVDALSTSDKRETVAFVEALTPLIDNKTFPDLRQGARRGESSRGCRRCLGARQLAQLLPEPAA
jgi:hypothetical protein